jgi:two-component system OmpR family response regulator
VLVVEDDVRMADMLHRGLSRGGLTVDVTGLGADALWMASSTPYDAIVLDVGLPDIDGFEVCRRLRADGVWAPILMLTARDATEDRVTGLDTGADDYLLKPFTFDELRARLRALVRRGSVERPAVLEAGGLRLDPAARKAWRQDVELELSPKELAVLEALMRRAGETLTRSDLLEAGWDMAYENRSNIIDAYVRLLRDKVDRPFGAASIETVRGHGYRIVP